MLRATVTVLLPETLRVSAGMGTEILWVLEIDAHQSTGHHPTVTLMSPVSPSVR